MRCAAPSWSATPPACARPRPWCTRAWRSAPWRPRPPPATTRGTVDCIDLGLIPAGLPFGQLSPVAGEGAYRYIERATRLVEAGEADAICTAPLSKEALHAAGHKYPGHTELLAHLTGTPEVSMMLVAPKLRVIHVTTHIGLLDAIRKIEPGLVERVITRGRATLVKAGMDNPRIGVCAINPHAGENGLFGQGEEEEKIIPAIKAVPGQGLGRRGPAPRRHPVLPRGPRRLRPRGRHVPRPGPRPGEGDGAGGRGERHHRPARGPHLRRPRHRLRHRGQGHRGRGLAGGGAEAGGGFGAKAGRRRGRFAQRRRLRVWRARASCPGLTAPY